jgi:hypothetical protein
MTTAIESQYHFTAEVKSKGKQQNRDGWAMVVDWKLPGSRYDLTLYGQDWETIEAHDVGDTVIITINQGNLKANKDGRYSTDYFWDMVSIEPTWIAGDGERIASDEAPPVQAPPKPRPDPAPPARTQNRVQPNLVSEPPPNPAAVGACHNHAVDFIIRGILPVPEGRELFGWIRELRDRFYLEINQAPVAPLHYCYEHDEERRQGKTGAWGHLIPETSEDAESWCMEVAQ